MLALRHPNAPAGENEETGGKLISLAPNFGGGYKNDFEYHGCSFARHANPKHEAEADTFYSVDAIAQNRAMSSTGSISASRLRITSLAHRHNRMVVGGS